MKKKKHRKKHKKISVWVPRNKTRLNKKKWKVEKNSQFEIHLPTCVLCGESVGVLPLFKPLSNKPIWGGNEMPVLGIEESINTTHICKKCIGWIHNNAIEWLSKT